MVLFADHSQMPTLVLGKVGLVITASPCALADEFARCKQCNRPNILVARRDCRRRDSFHITHKFVLKALCDRAFHLLDDAACFQGWLVAFILASEVCVAGKGSSSSPEVALVLRGIIDDQSECEKFVQRSGKSLSCQGSSRRKPMHAGKGTMLCYLGQERMVPLQLSINTSV